MTEEEKKAIQELKVLIGLAEFNNLSYQENQAINIALNLIDKQQKEIEELKVCLQAEKKYAEGLNNDIKSLLNIEPNNNFIYKDKIREKIKELQEKPCCAESVEGVLEEIDILKQLLEE